MFYEYYTNNPCFQKINEALYKIISVLSVEKITK